MKVRLLALRRAGHRCKWCGTSDHLQMDHIVPKSEGGATSLGNVQILCRACHKVKTILEQRGMSAVISHGGKVVGLVVPMTGGVTDGRK